MLLAAAELLDLRGLKDLKGLKGLWVLSGRRDLKDLLVPEYLDISETRQHPLTYLPMD